MYVDLCGVGLGMYFGYRKRSADPRRKAVDVEAPRHRLRRHLCGIGNNETGFAVMNTASYNLAPDTAVYKDREGDVMTQALKECRVLADFESLLDRLPRPLGVQANFGAMDATGAAAYYETCDSGFVKFDVGGFSDG